MYSSIANFIAIVLFMILVIAPFINFFQKFLAEFFEDTYFGNFIAASYEGEEIPVEDYIGFAFTYLLYVLVVFIISALLGWLFPLIFTAMFIMGMAYLTKSKQKKK